MHYLYSDFETWYSTKVRLKSMTLRQYLAATRVLGLAYCMGSGPIQYLTPDTLPDRLAEFKAIAESDDWTVVAHNAAFDIRVWRLLLDLPQPKHVHCTLELTCAAFPNQPGGYSLKALCETLNLGVSKLEMPKDLDDVAAMAIYCSGDVEACRRLHNLVVPRLHTDEIRVAELANAARSLFFEIDTSAALAASDEFNTIARESAKETVRIFEEHGADDGASAFNFDGSSVRSVKPHEMKRLLLENLGFDTQSISFKKINPEKLRGNTDATAALKASERTNKALFHRRNIAKFHSSAISQVDVEMGFFRAHTGRFSSPQPGCRGINLHNLSKRDKKVAKAIRSIFRLPETHCFVRADLANVEYRVEGWLTGSSHVLRTFANDLLNDPYLAFGEAATGIRFMRSDPIRQVFKAAVLALGYGMGLETFIAGPQGLLMVLADPTSGVTLKDFEVVCKTQGWVKPTCGWVQKAQNNTRAPDAVVAIAYHMRELFHRVHPEFMRTAKWLEMSIDWLSRSLDPTGTLERLYALESAPARERLELVWAGEEFGPGTKSVRVRCGLWGAPTVTWRDIGLRTFQYRGTTTLKMAAMQAGNKGYRPLTLAVMIENCAQSAARNALCRGTLQLKDMGYEHQLSVHDEILLVVEKKPETVLAAKQALLTVFGPGNQLGWDWAVCVNPEEIACSASMHEVPQSPEWWNNLTAESLKGLP